MSSFVSVDGRVIPQAIGDTSATQLVTLGTRICAKDTASTAYGEGEFIYLLGVASTVVGSVIVIDQDNFSTSLAAANATGYLATSMSINVASQYGWYQVKGKAVAKGLTGLADDASLYLTSTAGSLDDTVVAGDRIKGYAKTASALDTPSTGLVEIDIVNPFVDNGEAA